MWTPFELDVECIVCRKTLRKIDSQSIPFKMKKIASRRSRTPNWSLEEKQFLLDLIKERKEVVVIKPNAPNYYEEKDAAWNEILRALTVKFGTKFCGFSIKKLKTQWQNMKRLAREEVSLNGTAVQKYTRQSFEVCNILELVKDGILTKTENEPFIKPMLKADVEIKTECIDEEIMEASCSGVINCTIQEPTTDTTLMESSSSSAVSDHTEVIDTIEMTPQERLFRNRKTVETMTDPSVIIHTDHIPKDYQSFLRYASCEKDIKMESLKEERQIVKAMRETAELNKIIAEQRLKHFLWIKNQDMAMYSGEPGSGAGKGGGGGGSIREAGGSFGKMEAAREDEYFYKKQKEQIANLRGHMEKEIAFHQEQIKRHEDAIRRHKQTMADMPDKQ